MSRSLRRHHAAVARVRKMHILLQHMSPQYIRRPWRGFDRQCMNEPGHWVHEMMTRPARAKEHHIARLVARGLDPDGVVWPDNRKPHKYYW